jgi:glutaconyl-CoA/methylmalonyl-CoA decarboxylase subunit gamma
MKTYRFTINGNEYDARIVSFEDNLAEVEINGLSYRVELAKSSKKEKTPILVRSVAVPSTDIHPSVAKTSSPDSPKGTGTIKSPLPGIILEIYVKVGDQVKIGQNLVLLEAMKMENTIEADQQGKVLAVNKLRGDSVMEGDILIVIGE